MVDLGKLSGILMVDINYFVGIFRIYLKVLIIWKYMFCAFI